jgi:UDP-GlcNAc:undecaprenyl-phosphate GlcNAc-1-phosphate transferase
MAMRIAARTGFLDQPVGYKAHAAATPYLGGAALMAAFTVVATLFAAGWSDFGWLCAGALVLVAVGTIDDRHNLGIGFRFLVQVAAGLALWLDGVRWEPTGVPVLDLLITLLWVTGIANAFNLLDNIDGATGSVAATSAAGIAVLAINQDDVMLAALALGLSGACIGFLRFNLARPAGIFLGDGGSVPIGFLLAGMAMLIPSSLGAGALFAAVPLVGVAVFDTTLVVISRRRRGAPVLSGGRDHLTHRLVTVVGTPQAVAAWLVGVQACLCGLALLMEVLAPGWTVALTVLYVGVGASILLRLEAPPFEPRPVVEQVA